MRRVRGARRTLRTLSLQGILLHLQIVLPALGNAVNDHALEHLGSRKAKPAEQRVVLSMGWG